MAFVSKAEFEALKTSGWNSLDTTYDISYKSHWTMWHAIREFFQNALDEHDDAGITALPTLKQTPQGLLIADQGRGLGAEALLLRETKRASGDLRGKFGEGLKFACITALREGYNVHIGSPLYSIRPIVRDYQMVGKSFQIISFLWKPEAGTKTGTEVLIENYRGPDYRERFFPFVRSAATVDLTKATKGRFTRQLSLTTTPANSLYVDDIFVRQLGESDKASPYSYNLWGIDLNPDRDAETSAFRVHQIISWAWSWAPQKLIESLLQQVENKRGFEATLHWDYNDVSNAGELAASRWLKAWAAVYGEGGVLWTSESWARYAESYGYKPIHMPDSFTTYLRSVIPTDKEAVGRRLGSKTLWRTELPDSQLTTLQLSLVQKARLLTKAIEKRARALSRIKVVAAKFSLNPDTGSTLLGLWEEDKQTLTLGDSVLTSEREMYQVLLHELGHWFSHAPDLTAEHVTGLSGVSVYAMEVERERVAVEAVGVAAGPTQKAPELSWAALVAKGKQAGIKDADGYSKTVLRRMLNL